MAPAMPPAPGAEPAADVSKSSPEIKLPDPTTTGAKAPPAPKDGAAGDKKVSIPETAANIIQQYRARRPTS
jgi:hypothetical protein